LGRDVLDTVVLVVATAFAVAGVGGLILDQVRAARAERRSFSNLAWTLLWALGLSAVFVAAWLSGR
jgi:cytochrome c biogenesis protein ResB